MSRKAAAGARDWATVLSELAEVTVELDYERPAWRVRWTDGPTVAMLADRAQALSQHRVGEPLTIDRMRFERHISPFGMALAWLGLDAPDKDVPISLALGSAESAAEALPYPERCPPETRTAGELLASLAWSDPQRMGELLAQAHQPVLSTTPAAPSLDELPGRVESLLWLRGGPPPALLGQAPVAEPVTKADDRLTAASSEQAPLPAAHDTRTSGSPGNETRHETPVCARCGRAVPRRATGRPARYCSGACRSAAYRSRGHSQTPA